MPMVTGWITAIGILCLTALAPADAQEKGPPAGDTIHAVVPKHFPPDYMRDREGAPQGFAIDVMEAVARHAGFRVTYRVEESWQDTLKVLREGHADVIPNLGITTGRLVWFDFTAPVETFAVSIFVRTPTRDVGGLADLRGRKVAAVRANVAVKLLAEDSDIGTNVYDDPERALFALLSGEVDAMVYPAPVVWKLAQSAGVKDRIKSAGPPLLEVKRAIAVRKGDTALLQRLDKASRAFVGSKQYREIYTRWLGTPPESWTTTRVIYLAGSMIAVSLLLALGGSLAWRYRYLRTMNRKLEEQVRARTRQIERHAAQLEDANQGLQSFSYSVSHDLRAPLRAIDGFSRILLEDYEDKLDDEGKRLLGVVCDNATRMAQLIDDILAFSRTGRREMRKAEVDMDNLVRSVAEELRPERGGRQVHFEIAPLPSATGDAAMLRQVWFNLIANAVKFTSAKPVAEITIGSLSEVDENVYYIKDNGAGFDIRYADKLFGVFQRLHGVDEFEGTGIGLAIVKRIVTRHGGRVWAEGTVNAGATFCFSLPG